MAVNTDLQIAYLRALANEDSAGADWVRVLRDYFDGNHPTFVPERVKEFIGLKAKDAKHLFQQNLCQLVVAEAAGRLRVQGFSRAGTTPTNASEEEQDALLMLALDWWDANKMPAKQDELFEASLRDGDAYLIVDWDMQAARPRWSLNYAYDGTQGLKLHYDENTGELTFASKRWQVEGGRTRITMYFPDRVEKYISTLEGKSAYGQAGWEPVTDGDSEPWPIPWPYGMPVIPFLNPGGSEFAQAIPPQDALNKAAIDLVIAQDTTGLPAYWGSGIPPVIDPSTGEEKAITLGPGSFLRMTDPAAAAGVLPSADLSQLINVVRHWTEVIAAITSTPVYRLLTSGATPPSGDSLEMQESALIAKVRRKQTVFGDAFEQAFYVSIRLWNAYRPGEAVEEARIDTQWADPRSFSQRMNEATGKKMLEIPDKQLWAEMGYTQKQIEDFERWNQEKQAAQANLGDLILQRYDQNNPNI